MLVAQDLLIAYMASTDVVNQIHYLTDNTPGSQCVVTFQLIFLKYKNINTENLYSSTMNKLNIEMSSLKSMQPIAWK